MKIYCGNNGGLYSEGSMKQISGMLDTLREKKSEAMQKNTNAYDSI